MQQTALQVGLQVNTLPSFWIDIQKREGSSCARIQSSCKAGDGSVSPNGVVAVKKQRLSDIERIRLKIQTKYRSTLIVKPPAQQRPVKQRRTKNRRPNSDRRQSEQKSDYQSYLCSAKWRQKREEAFTVHGRQCKVCGATERLQCHHTTYDRFGNENVLTDIHVLCHGCHEKKHGRRFSKHRRRDPNKATRLDREFRAIIG